MTIRSTRLGAALLLAAVGCSHTNPRPPAADARAAVSPGPAAEGGEPAGAELWSENCSRCHNLRPPQSFSTAQWDTIVHHMRLRANLTGEEARKITEFLQASN